jgi:hypothetical protein
VSWWHIFFGTPEGPKGMSLADAYGKKHNAPSLKVKAQKRHQNL